MDVFANALAQAVQDLKTAEELESHLHRASREAQEMHEEAIQNRRELERLVEMLTARVTGQTVPEVSL